MMTKMKFSEGQRSIKTNNKFFSLRVEAHQHGRQMENGRVVVSVHGKQLR